jgi:predicted dehydrogenase
MTDQTSPGASSARTPRIRLGLVGFGNWAHDAHIPVLALLPQYEITAVYSQRGEAARKAAEEFGIPHVAGTLDELVNHPDVDMVLVLTTAPQHEVAVRAAIAAGKDVYSEWPLTADPRTSAELLRLAKEAGVRTVIGVQRDLAAAFRYARDLIDDGYVGSIRSVRMHASVPFFGGTRPEAMRWSIPEETFLSVVAVFGGHLLTPLFSVVGRPGEFSAVAVNQFPEVSIQETGEKVPTTAKDQLVLAGTLVGGGVLSVHIEGGKQFGSGVQIDITGTAGDLRISNTSAYGGVNENYQVEGGHEGDTVMAPLPIPAQYDRLPESDLPTGIAELGELYLTHAEDVVNGTSRAPGFDHAVWLQGVFAQIDTSQRTGQRMTVRNDES